MHGRLTLAKEDVLGLEYDVCSSSRCASVPMGNLYWEDNIASSDSDPYLPKPPTLHTDARKRRVFKSVSHENMKTSTLDDLELSKKKRHVAKQELVSPEA